MASTRNAGKEVDYGEDSSEVCPRRAAAGRLHPCVAAPDPRTCRGVQEEESEGSSVDEEVSSSEFEEDQVRHRGARVCIVPSQTPR